MKKETFRKGVKDLATCFSNNVTSKAMNIWWRRFQEHKFSEEDFKAGCLLIMDTCKHFPCFAELLENCKKATRQNAERHYTGPQNRAQKQVNNDEPICAKHSDIPMKFLQNTKEFLDGKIDKSTWSSRQEEIKTATNF